jgi:hypothetical protein
VAIGVLPTHTRTAIRGDTRAFLTSLSELIEISTATMCGRDETVSPTEQARQLDRKLQQFRVTAKPLVAGVAGLAGRRSIRRGLRIFRACDRYGRGLARSTEQYQGSVGSQPLAADLATAFASAAAQARHNIDALLAIIDGADSVTVDSTTDELDAAEPWAAIGTARANRGPIPDDSSPRCTRFERSNGPSSPRRPTSAHATASSYPAQRRVEAHPSRIRRRVGKL